VAKERYELDACRVMTHDGAGITAIRLEGRQSLSSKFRWPRRDGAARKWRRSAWRFRHDKPAMIRVAISMQLIWDLRSTAPGTPQGRTN